MSEKIFNKNYNDSNGVNMDCIVKSLDIRSETCEHLENVGNATKQICPIISKYCLLLSYANKPKSYTGTKSHNKMYGNCQQCGNAFLPDNCRVRLHARPVLTKKMKRLISRHQRYPWILRRTEREKVTAFKTCCNKIIYQCLKCGVYTEFNGSRQPVVPLVINSSTHILYCQRKRRKKKELNAGLGYCLNDSMTSLNSDRSPNSPFPSFAETPINYNKLSLQTRLSVSNRSSPFKYAELLRTITTKRTSVPQENENRLPLSEKRTKATSTPKPSKKYKNSLLLQMLKEDEEKRRFSSSSLSSFLSSI